MAEITPRYSWYQTDVDVMIEVFVKNIKKEHCNVVSDGTSLNLLIDTDDEGNRYRLTLDLWGKIVQSALSYVVGEAKIRIRIKKCDSGVQWPNLEKNKEQSKIDKKTKNWDAITKELESQDNDKGVTEVFQQIFSNGNDDVKKAMEKSYYESHGTVLSTNWNEVGARQVESHPVEGVEFRKY